MTVPSFLELVRYSDDWFDRTDIPVLFSDQFHAPFFAYVGEGLNFIGVKPTEFIMTCAKFTKIDSSFDWREFFSRCLEHEKMHIDIKDDLPCEVTENESFAKNACEDVYVERMLDKEYGEGIDCKLYKFEIFNNPEIFTHFAFGLRERDLSYDAYFSYCFSDFEREVFLRMVRELLDMNIPTEEIDILSSVYTLDDICSCKDSLCDLGHCEGD